MIPVVLAGGKHLILELWTDKSEILRDADKVSEICVAAAKKANANIIHTYFYHFGQEYGVSGVVVLAESHISIHTWPESGYCAIDVFMCGKCEPKDTLSVFESEFAAKETKAKLLVRPI